MRCSPTVVKAAAVLRGRRRRCEDRAAAHGDRSEFRGATDAVLQALRLAWTSDAFLAQVLYRAQSRLDALGIPVLPRFAHGLGDDDRAGVHRAGRS